MSTSPEKSDPRLSEAQASEDHGLFEQAAKLYVAILKDSPSSRPAQLGLGRSFANQGDCATAAETMREILPASAGAATVVGTCHYRFHRFDQAIPYLQRAIRLDPKAKDAAIFLGRSYADSGRYEQAIATLRYWLKGNPEDPDVLYWLGKFNEGLAEATFDKMAQAHPDSYVVYQVDGQNDIERKEYDKAVVAFQHALALAPDSPGLHYWLGNAYWCQRSFGKAQSELQKELQASPNHPQANYMMGDIFVSLRDPEKAIPFLEKAVKLNPYIWDAHRSLGRALVMQGKYDEAIRQFRIVADNFPTDETIHGLLSNAYRRAGNMAKAEEEGKIFQKLSDERLARVPKPTVPDRPAAESHP